MRHGTLVFLLLTSLSVATMAVSWSPLASPRDALIVISSADSGPGTLRQALLDAVNGDTITFHPAIFPPTEPVSISLVSALPEIAHGNLTIDASNSGVVIDGSALSEGDGLLITSDGNTIRGLQIINFPGDGVDITDAAKGNTIGGDATMGSAPRGEGNVITLNSGHGVHIHGAGTVSNTLCGNLIGLDVDGTEDIRVQALAISPDYASDQTLLVGTEGHGVWRTTDGGLNWTMLSSGLTISSVLSLAISPDYSADATVLAGTVQGGIFKSTDGGTSWERADGGVTAADIQTLAMSPDFPGDGSVYAGTWEGVFASTDGGNNWDQRNNGLATVDIRALAVSPDFAADGTIFVGTADARAYRSTDQGYTWTDVSGDWVQSSVTALAVSPNYASDHTVFAATSWGDDACSEIFKSTDAASSWTSVGGSPGWCVIFALEMSPDYALDQTLLAGDEWSGTYRSTDGGASWTPTATGYRHWAIAVSPGYASDQTVFVGARADGVLKSEDGGITWTELSSLTERGNGESGVSISDGAQWNMVGGDTAGQRNVVSNNGRDGVSISGSATGSNTISGNYIGTATSGMASLGNGMSGVNIQGGAHRNVVGGSTAGERNVISGNGHRGVEICGTGTESNTLVGNYIGTDASGTASLGDNGYSGVLVCSGAQFNSIGGTTAEERNVISGNDGSGVQLEQVVHNTVSGNLIGTDAGGGTALGNGGDGVAIRDAWRNAIGGTTSGERNTIGGNGGSGVSIGGSGATSNTVSGNYIGTNATGTSALPNGMNGVSIDRGASHNLIGGSSGTGDTACAGECNLISGNGSVGVRLGGADTSGNTVSGNFIGTDVTGTSDLGNGYEGVSIDDGAFQNTVGGSNASPGEACAGGCNLLSGNDREGVWMGHSGTVSNTVSGNYIGTDVYGAAALGNQRSGIHIENGGSHNVIGGDTPGERNLISANSAGISMGGDDTVGNVVSGNYIGADASGTGAIPNRGVGLTIYGGASQNLIGGSDTPQGGECGGECNLILGNESDGVHISGNDTLSNTISQNSIHANVGRGIELRDGGNLELAAPVITRIHQGTGIAGGTSCAFCTIEVFSDDEDEGRVYEGTTTADADGDWSYAKGSSLTGPHVTATATDLEGNTSEFSMVPFLRVNASHNWVDGQMPLPNTPVGAAVIDRQGVIKGTGSALTDGQGRFSTDLQDGAGNYADIATGDFISVTLGAGLVITAEVVSMTGDVDIATDTVSGNIPDASEGQQVRAEIWDLIEGPGDVEGAVQAAGSYSLHFEDFDIRDGHMVVIWYRNEQGNYIGIIRYWLRIEARASESGVWGGTLPDAAVSVTVENEGVRGIGTTTSTSEGDYWTDVYSGTHPIAVAPGDTVTVVADGRESTMSVESLSGVMDFDTDSVCGMAPPNAVLRVDVWGGWSSGWYTVDDRGLYCAEFDFDLKAGHQGDVALFDESGHKNGCLLTFREREVTSLTLGDPLEDSVQSMEYRDYELEVDSGEQLLVEVTPLHSIEETWLYGRVNDVPSRAQYALRSTRPTASGTYELLVSPTRLGIYYFSVLGWDISAGQGTYSIVARSVADGYLSDVQPVSAGNTGGVTLNVRGFGFVEGMGMELRRTGSPALTADGVMHASATEMAAEFDLAGADSGLYDAVVIWPDDTEEALDGVFEVLTGGAGPQLEASLDAPDFVRPGRNFVLWLDYANTGDADMVAPLFIVSSPDGAPMRLAEQETFEDGSVQILGVNPDGLAGSLSPGASGSIPVTFQVPPGTSGHEMVDFDLAIMISDTLPIDWAEVEDEVRPPDVVSDVWEVLWPGLTAQIGDTWGDYRQALADDASYLSTLGRQVSSVRELFGFEVRKALGMNPRTVLAGQLDAYSPAPGIPLQFGRVFPGSLEGRFYLGPMGRGWSHGYDIHLEEQSDGDVLLHFPGSFTRLFAGNGDGTYAALPGDYGALTREGNVFELTEKNGTLYRFRADGQLDYVEDPNGNRITSTYDGDGRLIEIGHSTGDSFALEYDADGRVSRLTDHAGRITEYGYDATGEHLLSVTAPGARVTTYTHSAPSGQPTDHCLLCIDYPDGTHQHYAYEELGRLSEEHLDDDAERISYTYDAFGRIHVTDATGETAVISPNEHGRPAKVRDALDSELGQEYDPRRNLSQLTDPAGQPYEFDYDHLGNVIGTQNPLGHHVRLAYDTRFSQIASLEDPRGNRSAFEYDDEGNLTSLAYPDDSQEVFAYDTAGNATSHTSRSGDVITYTYNPRGQLLRKDYPDGSWVAYTYDAAGNMLTAADISGTTTMAYDSNTDLLTRIDYPSGQFFAFSYNDAGQRDQRLDQDGHELNYAYDIAGRLSGLSDEDGAEIVSYEYDANGRLSRESKGNGTYTTYQYDAAGQVLSIVNCAADDGVHSRFDYTYDVNGNRTSVTTLRPSDGGPLDGTTTYAYDLIGQLVGVAYPDGREVTYEYDAAGNRVTVTDDGVATGYTSNALNQYTQVGNATYTYDENGSMTSQTGADGTTTYEYDFDNRLIRVTTPLSGTWDYTYDALGNRVTVSHDGVVTRYVHDPIGLVDVAAEYDSSGALVARYVHGLGLVSRVDAAGDAAYYGFDATGHTRQLTDDTGAVANTYDYTPFGVSLWKAERIPNPFRYVGQLGVMGEGQELAFMRARHYHRQLGRFLSMDPIRYSEGTNLYGYVNNSPMNLIDPSGLVLEGPTYLGTKYGVKVLERYGPNVAKEIIKDVATTLGVKGPTPIGSWFFKRGVSRVLGIAGWIISELLFPETLNEGEEEWLRQHEEAVPGDPPSLPSGQRRSVGTGITENITSDDPNEKGGPAGYGEERLVGANDELQYVIYFENKPEAGAPAQEVFVSDYLAPDLDWTTFRLREMAWGDHVISVPEDTTDFYTRQTVEDYREGVEKSWWVDVQVALNLETGRVRWLFHTLDPDTGELPADVLAGFLPPNDPETGSGEGHVSFAIRPRGGAPDGTVLTNTASIVFDVNDPIVTNEVSNTIRRLTAYLPLVMRGQ